MEFKIETQLVSPEEITAFEELLKGLKLPEDYKEHMAKFNGGYPIEDAVGFEIDDEFVELEYLHPIKYGDPTMEEELVLRNELPNGHISIGQVLGGGLSLSLEADYGAVFVYYEDMVPVKVANSFMEFTDRLKNDDF